MSEPLMINGWRIYFHPCFISQVEALVAKVERAKAKDPDGFRKKAAWIRLASIVQIVRDEVPQDPGHGRFRQGGTLGAANTEWRRVKFGGQRYRLFFRFHSAGRIIAFCWVNDEDTPRTYGSGTDAYKVFRSMLDKRNPPTDWAALLDECEKAAAEVKALNGRLCGLIDESGV
jgi:toxin YhaV